MRAAKLLSLQTVASNSVPGRDAMMMITVALEAEQQLQTLAEHQANLSQQRLWP